MYVRMKIYHKLVDCMEDWQTVWELEKSLNVSEKEVDESLARKRPD